MAGGDEQHRGDDAEWEQLAELARAAASGDGGAWERLWAGLRPHFEQWIANPRFLPQLNDRPDRRRDAVILAWEKLQERDHARLRSFVDGGGSGFRAWTYRVFKNLGIDYVRTLPEHVRHRSASSDPDAPLQHWWDVVTLDFELSVPRDPVTLQDMVRRMLAFLDETVPDRQRRAIALRDAGSPDADIAEALGVDAADVDTIVTRGRDRLVYRAVVELWIQEYTAVEIAERLQLDDSAHAARILGAAKQLLRRHFRPDD